MKRIILLCSFILLSVGARAQTEKKDSMQLEYEEGPVTTTFEAPKQHEVMSYVDQFPTFPGGPTAYDRFIKENLIYPNEAIEKSVQGKVYISMVVDEYGNHYDEKLIKGHPLLGDEALRLVKLMPKWEPGKMNGKPVKVKTNLIVTFKLPVEDSVIEKK